MNTGDESSHTTVILVMWVVSDTRNVCLFFCFFQRRVHFIPWNLFIQLYAMALVLFHIYWVVAPLSCHISAQSGSLFQQTSDLPRRL